MSVVLLGISGFYHDAAAAVVRDGEIVAAAQEERFTRKKHDPRFPRHAINYCLGQAFIEPTALDAIVFYDHPLLSLERVLATVVATAPASAAQWRRAGRSMLGVKLFVEEHVRRALRTDAGAQTGLHGARLAVGDRVLDQTARRAHHLDLDRPWPEHGELEGHDHHQERACDHPPA